MAGDNQVAAEIALAREYRRAPLRLGRMTTSSQRRSRRGDRWCFHHTQLGRGTCRAGLLPVDFYDGEKMMATMSKPESDAFIGRVLRVHRGRSEEPPLRCRRRAPTGAFGDDRSRASREGVDNGRTVWRRPRNNSEAYYLIEGET